MLEPRIVNGEETTQDEWSEHFSGVVALAVATGEGMGGCTGTLIDPEVILTARHCVSDVTNNPSEIKIHVGLRIDYFANPLAEGAKVIIHEDADMALVLLDKKIPSLRLYPIRDRPIEEVGDNGTIVGYGITDNSKQDGGTQRWGNTTLLGFYEYPGFGKLVEVGDPTGGCHGDSGGPFFTEQNGESVVSGVTSFGTGEDCLATGGGYWVHVFSYRDWINEKMEELTGHDLSIVCGNGEIEGDEVCERGDKKECVEFGNYLEGTSAPCNINCNDYDISDCYEVICGDGKVEGREVCDDGNLNEGDYCSADCARLTGNCGDGELQQNEECDDGNNESEDGCSAFCSLECGNGRTEASEECDDGNTTPGDGCDQFCKLEIEDVASGGCSSLLF